MLIQVSSGKGPKECEYACYIISNALLNEFKSLKVVSTNYSDKECLKSIVLYTDENLSHLEGTMQWIGKSPFRPHHKRKNWFIDVSVLKEEEICNDAEDIRYEAIKARGHGGQHVNKTCTAIRAVHVPTGISVVSMDERSQIQNKKMAYLRLLSEVNSMRTKQKRQINYDNWNNHNNLIRGNPIKIIREK